MSEARLLVLASLTCPATARDRNGGSGADAAALTGGDALVRRLVRLGLLAGRLLLRGRALLDRLALVVAVLLAVVLPLEVLVGVVGVDRLGVVVLVIVP